MTEREPGVGARVTQGARDLLAALPPLHDFVDVDALDLRGIPSVSMTLGDLADLSAAAADAVSYGRAVVITHGTDTLEETAFALALTLPTHTPIVLTAAMRRADAPGADGPANLLAAIRVAAHEAARSLGVLVVADDEIHLGHLVRKNHSFRTHAFTSLPLGPIGWVVERRVRIALKSATRLPRLRLGCVHEVVIPIVEAGQSLECVFCEMFEHAAIDGLVLSLPGAGHLASQAIEPLTRLAKRIPIVFATRTGAGETLRATYAFAGGEIDLISRGLIPAGVLDARKARVLLQLLLSDRADREAVNATFGLFN